MKKLNIPYFSQYDKSVPEEWQSKVCGIACLKMIFDFLHIDINSLEELIDEGVAIGGFDAKAGGWYHDAISKLLRNHGVLAYNQEFRQVKFNPYVQGEKILKEVADEYNHLAKKGLDKIRKSIDEDLPVIISVHKDFSGTSSNHLVLVTGYGEDEMGKGGFFIHDPNSKTGSKDDIFVENEDFYKGWRKLAIFIEK